MSTKELYEAHALITKDKRIDQSVYNLVDEAIEKYIEAEKYLRIHLEAAALRQQKDVQQIYQERFKTVICRVSVKPCKDIPVLPDGTEFEQLQYLADYHGCPKSLWQ